jgi:hypothetical protein
VLIVDDEPDEQRTIFRDASGAATSFEVLHPEEVEGGSLDDADLVLVDYVIKNWPSRAAGSQIGLQPVNGIALAAVLREQANSVERPTGFAIHTGRPEALWLTPAEPRSHLIARAYNLEWVFLKSGAGRVIQQASILAEAIRTLPPTWPGDDYAETMKNARNILNSLARFWER